MCPRSPRSAAASWPSITHSLTQSIDLLLRVLSCSPIFLPSSVTNFYFSFAANSRRFISRIVIIIIIIIIRCCCCCDDATISTKVTESTQRGRDGGRVR
ncbi:hypothetical protein Mapa_014118 [Marchantia paleacea]|nr:hypothetical protein Mapa_014118 [Marchantia paleacea]